MLFGCINNAHEVILALDDGGCGADGLDLDFMLYLHGLTDYLPC